VSRVRHWGQWRLRQEWQRFQIKLNIIPVIPPLIKKALFGGG
jgi:hypothetical protein